MLRPSKFVHIPTAGAIACFLTMLAPALSQDRPRVVVVRPVILCDDDGGNPARFALPKRLVDQVYTRAGLEFVYLAPVRWHYSKARLGEINLDQIVREGTEQGFITRDRRVVTLLFVSGVDGHRGPLGRGQQNGDICFVCLGPEGAMTEPAARAFVVAHEVGHCFGLRHAVDDPAVPDDVPNLQGDGEFIARLAIEGLHPTQRDTVLRSPLVMDRVRFHEPPEARRLISAESWEPYISAATDDMLRFSIGLEPEMPLPQEPAQRTAFASEKYAEKVLAFTEAEQELLDRLVKRLSGLLDEQWPLVARLPWHFIKVESSFCKGMAHTRGMSIVLSETSLGQIQRDEIWGMKLLLHEKLHVVQRLNGLRFETLYRGYGFRSVKLSDGEVQRLNLAQNPDAFEPNQAIALDDSTAMLVTILAHDEDTYRFRSECRLLEEADDGEFRIGSIREEDESYRTWHDSFPVRTGHDHPNEISAYLSGLLLEQDLLQGDDGSLGKAQQARVDQTREAFSHALRLDGE